ncbi:hypothetical protein LO80_08130 [Candidatus Francisella endociliophora]|uniref:Uncharacterized protein n=1 Tax=Candidatus Francisella endociliophora TaxID=653937 RepID=A0A097EQU6_9GAMM|nr:hypothetical protein [Francisella sp. FSC1006]AIT09938.1 hypothetical protein LO80_08130 [Francisella sp. FSC1006]
MKKAVLLVGMIISFSAYSSVYETNDNGVPEFSNIKSKNAEKIELKNDPISVIDADSIPKNIVWGHSEGQHQQYMQQSQNTMQADFPEQFTDNYYDFYGRNHHYNSLMSSTIGMSMYSPNDANNMRLQRNY